MTYSFTIFLWYILLIVVALISIPLIGIIATVFDTIVMKRKSKSINKKLNKIESIANQVLKDFSNHMFFEGLEKTEEMAKIEKELLDEIKKEEA